MEQQSRLSNLKSLLRNEDKVNWDIVIIISIGEDIFQETPSSN